MERRLELREGNTVHLVIGKEDSEARSHILNSMTDYSNCFGYSSFSKPKDEYMVQIAYPNATWVAAVYMRHIAEALKRVKQYNIWQDAKKKAGLEPDYVEIDPEVERFYERLKKIVLEAEARYDWTAERYRKDWRVAQAIQTLIECTQPSIDWYNFEETCETKTIEECLRG